MDFTTKIETKHHAYPVKSYFDGRCLQCKSTDSKIRSSYKRHVDDLGTPFERRIADVTMAKVVCNACGCSFTPVPMAFPLKYEYSRAVITWALARFYHENASANQIRASLKLLHNVDVPEDTIYSWIKRLSEDYAKTMVPLATDAREEGTRQEGSGSNEAAVEGIKSPVTGDDVKTIAVDGTFVTMGVDVVGKKKPAVFLSLTRRPDGTLLPKWPK